MAANRWTFWALAIAFSFLSSPTTFAEDAPSPVPTYLSTTLRIDPRSDAARALGLLHGLGAGFGLNAADSTLQVVLGIALDQGHLCWSEGDVENDVTIDHALSPRIGLRRHANAEEFLELSASRSILLHARYDTAPDRLDVRNHRVDGHLFAFDMLWNRRLLEAHYLSFGLGLMRSSIDVSTQRQASDMVFLESETQRHTFPTVAFGWLWAP